jgi:hypothetical protein
MTQKGKKAPLAVFASNNDLLVCTLLKIKSSNIRQSKHDGG